MKPFSPGDVVRRIHYAYGPMIIGNLYTVEVDSNININGDNCIKLRGYTGTFDRKYFELATDVYEDTVDDEDPIVDHIDSTPFKVGDIVIRNTDKYEDSFMKKGKSYKITQIINDDIIEFDGSSENYSSCYFSRIKFKFNVGDIVQSIKKNGTFKTGKVHTLSQNGSHFYFENVRGNQSIISHKVSDFELVAECKNAHSNNDGCVSYDNLDIDFSNFERIRLNDFDVSKLQGTSCPPTLNVGYSGPVRNVGDSIYPNPITPMKTFNEYAVEAFMSDAHNREEATNTLKVLSDLNDNLDIVQKEIERVKKVLVRDIVKMNNAMSNCEIDMISQIISENPAVKEFVERFMENKLIDVIPPKEKVSVSIADKFK